MANHLEPSMAVYTTEVSLIRMAVVDTHVGSTVHLSMDMNPYGINMRFDIHVHVIGHRTLKV